jgi:hypothetical protein
MNKSIRNLTLSAAILLSATPMFANIFGSNPHPQVVSASLSLGDLARIALTVSGL